MYKAVFIDMDGTLLRKDHTVSPATKTAIKKLTDQGILVVPISARPLHGMLPITNTLVPETTPIVSLNGSYIFHNNEIIYQINVALPQTTHVHQLIDGKALSGMYYSQMNWYAQTATEAISKEQRITPVPIIVQPFNVTLANWEQQQSGPNKILIAGDSKLILQIEKELLQQFTGELNIFKSQPRYLELMHLQASKTTAIQFLMKKYKLQQHEIVAIGDNYNDKGMIEFAGIGVAMGNAPDEIKEVADFVTDNNNNDGVAKAIQHFFN